MSHGKLYTWLLYIGIVIDFYEISFCQEQSKINALDNTNINENIKKKLEKAVKNKDNDILNKKIWLKKELVGG